MRNACSLRRLGCYDRALRLAAAESSNKLIALLTLDARPSILLGKHAEVTPGLDSISPSSLVLSSTLLTDKAGR